MKKIFQAISTIIKGFFTLLSFLRSLFFNLLFFGIIAFIVITLFSTDHPDIADNSILKLTLSGKIVEQPETDDSFNNYFTEMLGLSNQDRQTLLQDILDSIYQAQEDPRITALLLDLKEMEEVGLNQLSLIGSALSSFRESGKPVIAAEDYYSQNQYFLASHADKIFLNPMGGVYLNGFGLYRLYFHEALEKLKINFHVFQVGTYKSALEPFTRSSMSPEDRSQSRAWLVTLWKNYCLSVSEQRSVKVEDINAYINDIPENLREVDGDMARLALEYNLVDELKQRHEIRDYLSSLTGSPADSSPRLITFQDYLTTVTRSYQASDRGKDTVALIVAQGTLIPGTSSSGMVGADSIVSLLRKARKDSHIKAVVLRIDSGGGSAFASELIRQELLELKKSGKPLVVSMGSFAASGGYWIAADADEIWASPNTLTGSIGIFMALPTFENLLNSNGIFRDGVGTTNLASGLSLSQPLSNEVSEAIQSILDNGYKTFISVVANGRHMTEQKVEQVAQGRVFGGEEAKHAGLIDNLGTLPQAVRSAAQIAGLDDYNVTTLAEQRSFKDHFLNKILIEATTLLEDKSSIFTFLTNIFAFDKSVQKLLLFRDPNGIYAHCMIHYF
jgi:protease-4